MNVGTALASLKRGFLSQKARLLLDGRLCDASDGGSFAALNPADETRLAEVALAGEADVSAAVTAARRAFDSGPWPRMAPRERKRLLQRVAELIERHRDELAVLESLDTGLTLSQTRGRHLARAVENFRYFAELPEHTHGEAIASHDTHLNIVLREPVGVIAILSPWNAPLALSSMRIAAALAFGNTVVVKPAEQAPLTASRLAELAVEAELPQGVWNLVQGPARPTGEALVRHPGIDAIGLTGGTATGRAIMAAAANGLKPLSLELGGKSASLVFADADWDRALDGTLLGIFANNGEQCLAGSRILVEDAIYDRFVSAFVARARAIRVGDPLDPASEVGPLVSAAHRQRVTAFLARARAEGASLLAGGGRPPGLGKGHYLEPSVLAEEGHPTCASREEIFGPVATLRRFSGEDDAVRQANDSAYGLAGYVWSQGLERAHRVARLLRTGTVWVNTPLFRDVRAPFGGIKDSGFGREGGHYGLDFLTHVKTVCVALQPLAIARLGVGARQAPDARTTEET